MKKILLLLTVLLMGINAFAVDTYLEKQAEELYSAGSYGEAADIYTKILSEGKESSDLYYNLGNCYYKLGDNTHAIINYERALLLNPRDAATRYNLQMAQKAIVDKIEVLPELFLIRWYKNFETAFSADQWGYISVVLFIIFFIMATLFFYSRSVVIKKIGFIVGIIIFFFTIGSIYFAVKQNNRISQREYAIITAPSVTVKGAPNASGTSLFLIHEGLKVRIVEELGDWYNIRLADGNEGWIAKADIEVI